MIRDTADGPVVAPEIPTRTGHNARLKVGSTTDQRVRDGTTFSRVVPWPRQVFLPLSSHFTNPLLRPCCRPLQAGLRQQQDRAFAPQRPAYRAPAYHYDRWAEKNLHSPRIDSNNTLMYSDGSSSSDMMFLLMQNICRWVKKKMFFHFREI